MMETQQQKKKGNTKKLYKSCALSVEERCLACLCKSAILKNFHSSLTLPFPSKRWVDQCTWPMGKGLLLLDSIYVKYL